MKNKFRNQFDDNYDADAYGIAFNPKVETERSMTKQAFAEECDINNVMKKYEQTGVLPEGTRELLYGDFSDVGSFQEAQDIVLLARAQFEALPARVRDRFNNSPEKFLEFTADENNRAEMENLGLLKPKVEPEAPKEENPEPVPKGVAKSVETPKGTASKG